MNLLALPVEWAVTYGLPVRYMFPFEAGRYLVQEYDMHVQFTAAGITLVPGSQLKEEEEAATAEGGGSFLLTQRPHLPGQDDIHDEFSPPPPRPYPDATPHDALVPDPVQVPLREDIFGRNHSALLANCLSCGTKEVQGVPHLILPSGLTPGGLDHHIRSQCVALATATAAAGPHHSFHLCASYLRLSYTHTYLTLDTLGSGADSSDVSGGFTSWQEGSATAPLEASPSAHDPDLCTDPLWCGKTRAFKREIERWQNPRPGDFSNCQDAKFLLYVVPNDPTQSLVDLVREVGFMLRFAMCHDRILVLSFQHFSESPGSLVGLFGSLTSCPISTEMISTAQPAKNGLHVGLYPCQRSKVVFMTQLPTTGHCSSYSMHWTGSFDILYGYQLGLAGHIIHTDNGVVVDTTVRDVYDDSKDALAGLASLFSSRRMVWLSQMVRYVVRPHPVLSAAIRSASQHHLHSSSSSGDSHMLNSDIPRPFATLFLAPDGGDGEEVARRCLRVLQRRAPFIKHIYLPLDSTVQLPLLRRYAQ